MTSPETALASPLPRSVSSGDIPEALLLGCVMRNPGSLDEAVPRIDPEHFRKNEHRQIWRAIVSLWQEGKTADSAMVAERLQRSGDIRDVGYLLLNHLWEQAWEGMNVTQYIESVRDHALLRGLESVGQAIAYEAQHPSQSSQRILEEAERRLFSLAEVGYDASVIMFSEVIARVMDDLDRRSLHGNVPGVLTGIESLDRILAGLKPAEMIVVGARPSVGKTAFAAAIVQAVAKNGTLVLFSSLEQSHPEIGSRALVAESGVLGEAIRVGHLDSQQTESVYAAAKRLRVLPIAVDDSPRQSVLRIAANARRLKRKQNLGMVVVDYLGLIEPLDRKQPRHEQVAEISKSLKVIAKDLQIPVVVLCQLNRNVEGRANSKPKLSDLRESGQIEQDADVVILLHREESNPSLLNVEVAKQRNGPTGEITVKFDRARMRFTDTVGEGVF